HGLPPSGLLPANCCCAYSHPVALNRTSQYMRGPARARRRCLAGIAQTCTGERTGDGVDGRHGRGVGRAVGRDGAVGGGGALARAAGVPPSRTVLDSPAKTPAELREALALGIAVNADNPQELERLDGLMLPHSPEGMGRAPVASSRSPLGIRVNPQVGGGSI